MLRSATSASRRTSQHLLSTNHQQEPRQPGLSQHWGGVYGTPTLNPNSISSSSTEAHSIESANGHGIGLMPHISADSNNPAPLRPVGLEFHVEALMKIRDPIARDALLPFSPNANIQPMYRFDVSERNTTVLYYGDQSGSSENGLTNEELIRMGNSLDTMTLTYYDAMCYCRHENMNEFLTCRCEHSNDPWAPPVIPQHVRRAAHTHHDKMQDLLDSALSAAVEHGNYKLMAVLKEAKYATTKSIHAKNVLHPNVQKTQILMNHLYDALYYSLQHNGTETSQDIHEALHLVRSFHCTDHHVVKSSDHESESDQLVQLSNNLNKITTIVNDHNVEGQSIELTKYVTRALEEATRLNSTDPTLAAHLKACQSSIQQDDDGASRRQRYEEETRKEEMKKLLEKKRLEEIRKKNDEEIKKRHHEENDKMKQSVQLRTRSHLWTECWAHGQCTFGEAPIDNEPPPIPSPQHLQPTVDYDDNQQSNNENNTRCEKECSDTAFGNYTLCYVACERVICVEQRNEVHRQQNSIHTQIEQVINELKKISKQELGNKKEDPMLGKRSYNHTKSLLSDSYKFNLQQQHENLQKSQRYAEKAEQIAAKCIDDWTHKIQITSLNYRNEMIKQKHLNSRSIFLKNELIHLEDDALDARLASARNALAAVETEYKRMTGEALADSYGDTAAAECFYTKQKEREHINTKLQHLDKNLMVVSKKLKDCRLDHTKCEGDIDVLYHDLKTEQQVLRKKWSKTSECITQHECALVKLNILRMERNNLTMGRTRMNDDDMNGGMNDHVSMLGDIPPALIPHPLAMKGSLFQHSLSKSSAKIPTGGYSNEKRSTYAYYDNIRNTCIHTDQQHVVEFTLLSGGMKGEQCVEFDTCFNDGDRLEIQMDCNGTSEKDRWTSEPPILNTSINVASSNIKKEQEDASDDIVVEEENAEETVEDDDDADEKAVDEDYKPANGRKQEEVFGSRLLFLETNEDLLSRTTIVWNQKTALLRSNNTHQCTMSVYSLPRDDGSDSKIKIGDYNIFTSKIGNNVVHINGDKCGQDMSIGCGYITYNIHDKCEEADAYLKSHSMHEEKTNAAKDRINLHTDGQDIDGKNSSVAVGNVEDNIEEHHVEEHVDVEDDDSMTNSLIEVPNVNNSKDVEKYQKDNSQWKEQKLRMIDRDIAQVEAWTNATSLRYHHEKITNDDDNDEEKGTEIPLSAAASAATMKEEKSQERASRVVRCLNLARGTEVFKVMENVLIKIGALDVTKNYGLTSGTKMNNLCENERNGMDIAKQLGLASMNTVFMEEQASRSIHPSHAVLSKRLYEASQIDTLLKSTLFLEQDESKDEKSAAFKRQRRHASFVSHPTNYDKVQWELNELTNILRERGVLDGATSTTKTSTHKLDPKTYSLVVVRDQLRASLNKNLASTSSSPSTSMERFAERTKLFANIEMNTAMNALHDATRIPYDAFATLVNVTLSCLCYPSVTDHGFQNSNYNEYDTNDEEESGSCGPTPHSYPVKKKYLLSPVFPMIHLPMTKNQVAERVKHEMERRVLQTRTQIEEEVKYIDNEAKRRATETTTSMIGTINVMRQEKMKLKEERTKHEELLKSTLKNTMLKLKFKHTQLNHTLIKRMKERHELQRRMEEENNKLEEKRKQHMSELNKMRRSEMKLEDDLRLQNLEDEEKWRKEENKLDDIYMNEKKKRKDIDTTKNIHLNSLRLTNLQKENVIRNEYNHELTQLKKDENVNIEEEKADHLNDEHELPSDKGHRLRGKKSRVHHSRRSPTTGQSIEYQNEIKEGNVRGNVNPNAMKTKFPLYWKYGSNSRHIQVNGRESIHFQVSPIGCYRENINGNEIQLDSLKKEEKIAKNALQLLKERKRTLMDRIKKNSENKNATNPMSVDDRNANDDILKHHEKREHELTQEILRVQSKISKV